MISLLNDSLDESQVHDSVLRSENQRDKPQLSNFLCRSVCGDVCLAASVLESFCVSPKKCLSRGDVFVAYVFSYFPKIIVTNHF